MVSNYYPPRAVGGAELVAHRFACELVSRGHDVAVFAGRVPRSDETGGEITLENVDGIDVHLLSLRSMEHAKSFFWDASGRRFRAVLHNFLPDVVHFHNLSGLGANLILEAKRLGIPTVCTVHDHWGFCALNTLLRPAKHVCSNFEECQFCISNVTDESGKALPVRLRRDYVYSCLSQVDHLVFPSAYLATVYAQAGFRTTATTVQSNGIDLARFSKAQPGTDVRLRIVVIGYLGEHKGFGLLLHAIERLAEELRFSGRWHLSIVGDGHWRARIARFAEDPVYREHVRYLGKLSPDQISSLLADSDLVLLPSLWPENEPVVLLEAIAAGIAQLASCIGGHRDIVVDGWSGLLFESGDVDDLVAKLTLYLESPDLLAAHGAYNWQRRDAYAQQTTVAAYERIYRTTACRPIVADAIVLCQGSWPTLPVAHFFNNFSLFEHSTNRIRFIYADWADSSLWQRAVAFFAWSNDVPLALILRCARMNIPVIAPVDSSTMHVLTAAQRPTFGYADFAEALSALRLVADSTGSADWRSSFRGQNLALDAEAAVLDPREFGLVAEQPAR